MLGDQNSPQNRAKLRKGIMSVRTYASAYSSRVPFAVDEDNKPSAVAQSSPKRPPPFATEDTQLTRPTIATNSPKSSVPFALHTEAYSPSSPKPSTPLSPAYQKTSPFATHEDLDKPATPTSGRRRSSVAVCVSY